MIVLHHIPDHSYDVIIVHLIAGHYRIVIFIILHVFCHSVDVQASEPFPLQKQLQGVEERQYMVTGILFIIVINYYGNTRDLTSMAFLASYP